ncbi:MAG: hypothetical protein LBD57_05810 [Endomicrobium sp.]|jgi:hypothetical protein|uniref:hypothetical protein n=1 Tax=Candidatus Endomicrobiellum cubanum TaxID=3242325 RepID=UPI00282A3E93|nr:hypothetical protein [Endomicrobium sp.]
MVIKALKKKRSLKKATKLKTKSIDEKKLELKNNCNSYIVIDYPFESENIKGFHYVIRVGASNEGYVELSFNNGEWLPCRFASGYWWFDWSYFTPGDHFISARLVNPSGDVILQTENRKCRVC